METTLYICLYVVLWFFINIFRDFLDAKGRDVTYPLQVFVFILLLTDYLFFSLLYTYILAPLKAAGTTF